MKIILFILLLVGSYYIYYEFIYIPEPYAKSKNKINALKNPVQKNVKLKKLKIPFLIDHPDGTISGQRKAKYIIKARVLGSERY